MEYFSTGYQDKLSGKKCADVKSNETQNGEWVKIDQTIMLSGMTDIAIPCFWLTNNGEGDRVDTLPCRFSIPSHV
jgi:hypothetical protein